MAQQRESPPAPELSLKMFAVPAIVIGFKVLKIDLTAFVNQLRFAYCSATLTTILIFLYIRTLVQSKQEQGAVKVVEKLATKSTTKTLTPCEYDKKECDKKLQSAFMSFAVIAFVHYKWGSPTPLLLQSVMQILNLIDDPMVQIHIFKKPATGKLERPFKTNNPLETLLNSSSDDAQSENKADDKKKK